MRKINTKLLSAHIESLGKKGMEKLVIKSDISQSLLDKLLRGVTKNPTLETINKLCLATGLSFYDLFPLDDEDEAA
tara:strand:- start:137 stop:364 length:228 start_codon:yes stop_codon:yes gene_type:complete